MRLAGFALLIGVPLIVVNNYAPVIGAFAIGWFIGWFIIDIERMTR